MKQYLFFGMCLIASPALAETCTFTLECYEGEACADTSYEIEIDLDNAQ